MTIEPADLAIIAAGREGLGIPENVEATPTQTLELLRLVPQDVAERMVATWRESARQGTDCWLRNHEREIAYWRELALTPDVAHCNGCAADRKASESA